MSQSPIVIPELSECEALAITQEIRDSVENVWELLTRAHSGKAWIPLGYKSWRDYAKTEFEISQSRAYQLLDCALIHDAVSTMVEKPNERQARALAPLKEDPVAVVKAWGIANERTNGKPTAKDVEAAVEEVKAAPVEADEIEPPKKAARVPAYQPSNGLMHADNAISQLKKIQHNDSITTQPLARKSDPFTSHLAAASVNQAASQRAVLDAMFVRMTDEEIEIFVAHNGSRFSPSRLRTARKELMRQGKVRACGVTKNSRNRTVQLFERI